MFPCGEGPLRVSLLYNTDGERLSALDAAVLAAFVRPTEGTAQVGANGGGARFGTYFQSRRVRIILT